MKLSLPDLLLDITDLGCHRLWEAGPLGRSAGGSGSSPGSGCSRSPERESLHSFFAALHTAGSHTGHHLWKKKGVHITTQSHKWLARALLLHSIPPELGQRRLKSSLVSRHRARPFISKRPFSGRRREYSFWAQWSQCATSSLSHRDGFIPGKQMHRSKPPLWQVASVSALLQTVKSSSGYVRVWLTQPSW